MLRELIVSRYVPNLSIYIYICTKYLLPSSSSSYLYIGRQWYVVLVPDGSTLHTNELFGTISLSFTTIELFMIAMMTQGQETCISGKLQKGREK